MIEPAEYDFDNGEWCIVDGFPHRVMRWVQPGHISEAFSVDAVLQTVNPDFVLNGGGPNLTERWNSNQVTNQEITLVKMVMSRTSPAKVRETTGDSAPEYNRGASWIADPAAPGILLEYDGFDFTGKKELASVMRQRESDCDNAVQETVSTIAPPEGGAPGWHIDPQRPTDLIHFGGMRWDRRKTVESAIAEAFAALGENVPDPWKGEQVGSVRHIELLKQLAERANGVDGWYKSVHRFDDPVMRYWENGTWTEHYSSHPAAWLDDPWNDEYMRYWDGQQWSTKTRSKEAERIREEKSQKRWKLAETVITAVVEDYKASNTPEAKRQRSIDAANARSRSLRDAASVQQEQFYRDRQIPWYRKR